MDDDSYTDACMRALRSLLADEAAARTLTLSALLSDLAASKLRDLEPDEAFFEALLVLPPMCWEDWALSDRCALHTLLIGLLRVPEVIAAAPLARPYITSDFLKACLERATLPADPADAPPMQSTGADESADGRHHRLGAGSAAGGRTSASKARAPPSAAPKASPTARSVVSRGVAGAADLPTDQTNSPGSAQALELSCLRALLHWAYRGADGPLRASIRSLLGSTLQTLSSLALPPPGVRSLLELLASIVRGIDGATPRPCHLSLVRDVLAPLHRPIGRLDETTPVISIYHEPLVHCLVSLLAKQPPLLLAALPPIFASWPEVREGNTAKEVLLLHELERLLEIAATAG